MASQTLGEAEQATNIAWDQIDQVVDVLARCAHESNAREDFYPTLLKHVVPQLSPAALILCKSGEETRAKCPK